MASRFTFVLLILSCACCATSASELFGLSTASAQSAAWRLAAPLHHARAEHQTVTLTDGRMMVLGGLNESIALNSCEVYDPQTDVWTEVAPLKIGRFRFQAVCLPDGRVFAAGGLTDLDRGTTATTELYDPTTDRWTPGPSMSNPREAFEGCLVSGSRVILVGGLDGNTAVYLNSADMYDEGSNTMLKLPDMPATASFCSAVFSARANAVFIPGGNQGGYGGYKSRLTQKFSLATMQWGFVDSMLERAGAAYNAIIDPVTNDIVNLSNDTAYGLLLTSHVEALDPVTGHWHFLGSVTPRTFPNAVVADDSVLLTGGYDATNVVMDNSCWFNLRSQSSYDGPKLIKPTTEHTSTYLRRRIGPYSCNLSRSILVVGGRTSDSRVLADCEILELSLGASSNSILFPASTDLHATTCAGADSVLEFVNTDCDSVLLSRFKLTGSNSSDFLVEDTSLWIAPNETTTLRIHAQSGVAHVSIAKLSFAIHSKSGDRDTSIHLTATFSDGNPIDIRVLINDQKNVRVGDTLQIPVFLDTKLKDASSLSLDLTYNTNMLEQLAPSFPGTMLLKASIYTLKERSNSSQMYVPGAFQIVSAIPLVTLRFRVMLSTVANTTLSIARLAPGQTSTSASQCLIINSDSALIALQLVCGESTLQSFMQDTTQWHLNISYRSDGIMVSIPAHPSTTHLSVFNELGDEIEYREIPPINEVSTLFLNTRNFASGAYGVQMLADGLVRSCIFVVSH